MGPKQKDQDYFYSITSYFEKEITDRELLCDTSELSKRLFLNSMCIRRILFFSNIKRAFDNIGKGIKCENKAII